MAISHQERHRNAPTAGTKGRCRRRILGRTAEPPALGVCGDCARRRREARRSQACRAVPRSAGSGSGERAPPVLSAGPPSAEGAGPSRRTQPGSTAATSAAATRPSSARGSAAASWTRVSRLRAPSPGAGPRPGWPTPAQACVLLAPAFPHFPGASRGSRGAMSGTYTTALEIIQDTIFPGARTPPRGRVDAERGGQATNGRPHARQLRGLLGAALAPSGAGPGVCTRRSVPSPSQARPRPPAERPPSSCRASRPRPCAPLIGGGSSCGALAETRSGLLGSGGWACRTPACSGASGPEPLRSNIARPFPYILGVATWRAWELGWREAKEVLGGRGCRCVYEKENTSSSVWDRIARTRP